MNTVTHVLVNAAIDRRVRERRPISYWDPRHHGDVVGIVEYSVTAGLVLYLLRYRLRRWWGRLRA